MATRGGILNPETISTLASFSTADLCAAPPATYSVWPQFSSTHKYNRLRVSLLLIYAKKVAEITIWAIDLCIYYLSRLWKNEISIPRRARAMARTACAINAGIKHVHYVLVCAIMKGLIIKVLTQEPFSVAKEQPR